MKLPEKYIEKMKSLLGDEYPLYEASLQESMCHCLRVNTLKISVDDFLRISPFSLSPVPWSSNSFYYNIEECTPSKHPYYYAGLYYLQEASATLPAAAIPIEPGDRVLDICAAPGGKSTELAARLRGSGVLVSNDISVSRIKALQRNIEAYGASNVIITCESPEKLSEYFPHYFDKILIDAPCSGEGMFRKSRAMVTAWEQNGNEKFIPIQRSILEAAVKMLSPGGSILYSTCTFDVREDEEQAEYLLSLDDSLSTAPLPEYPGFVKGNPVPDSVHLYPHRVRGEGHYAVLVKSNLGSSDARVDKSSWSHLKHSIPKLPQHIEDFLKHVKTENIPYIDGGREYFYSRLRFVSDKLYLSTPEELEVRGLRIMREGVYLGELKKNRFEPSQSFAMLLSRDAFDNVLDFEPDSIEVYKYLKGETLVLDSADSLSNGWVLVTVSGYPLGFGKLSSGVLKNKYLPGWRMTS